VTLGIAGNGAALVAFAAIPTVIGMAAHALYPDIPRELAFATAANKALHPAFGALALAAVFSAEASAADAVLFMLATSGSRDLYRGYVNPRASDADLLRIARLTAIGGAILGVAVAMMHHSIIDALRTFYGLLVVTLFVPILGGLYARGAGPAQGLASLAGVPVLLAVQAATGGTGYGPFTPVVSGVLASAAAFVVVSKSAAHRSVMTK
jgi:SSS family solute:Na+ symporter